MELLRRRAYARAGLVGNPSDGYFGKTISLSLRNVWAEVARRAGASAKFAGSGGAIVGTYTDEAMFQRLRQELVQIGCEVIKPILDPSQM